MDFGFSFDAVPTIDMILYFRSLNGDGWRKMEEARGHMLRQPKQLVDVTQADDGNIQSKSTVEQLTKGSHLIMGISKKKCLRTHHQ